LRKEDIVTGYRNVKEALQAGSVQKLYILKQKRPSNLQELYSLARCREVEIETLDREKFISLAGNSSVHRGVAALTSPYRYLSWEEMWSGLENKKEEQLILMLDHLEDPHNMGALLRTAEAAGVSYVIIPRDRSVQVNATVRRVAAGAAEWVCVVRVTNLAQTIRRLQEAEFWVYGADDDSSLPYYQADWSRRAVLVLGAEGKGLSRLVKENCDELVYLPMYGRVSSLNVSVAGGILMYDFALSKRRSC